MVPVFSCEHKQEDVMAQSFFQEKFNHSIVTALLFNDLALDDKERKLQEFINDADERYDTFCDNIARLLSDKETNDDINTLYLTLDGFSFVSSHSLEQNTSCVPVLTINKYSPNCPDISAYVEIALSYFVSYCNFAKRSFLAPNKSA